MRVSNLLNNLKRADAYYKRYGPKAMIRKALLHLLREKTNVTALSNSFTIPEITPLTPHLTNYSGRRLNLLIPSIQRGHIYGGIATALSLFEKLAQIVPQSRIIITDAPAIDYDEERFCKYTFEPANPDTAPKSILPMHDRYGKSFDVGPGDIFIATGWWTAYTLQAILTWQRDVYRLKDSFFIYFIQDYEPGFYPWSSRYVLAESTYRSEFSTFAIFNTKLLKNYFDSQGYTFWRSQYFDPVVNDKLKEGISVSIHTKRSLPFQILIYGRPSVDRNCFELIVQALKIWRYTFPNIEQWQVVSAGEAHPDVDLGGGYIMKSVGKLSLEGYMNLLIESSVGLSLMVSPHPSYPPLEMALYGMEVITNSFGPKDLSTKTSNITSLQIPTPEKIAAEIRNACSRVEQRQGAPAGVSSSILLDSDESLNFLENLKQYLIDPEN